MLSVVVILSSQSLTKLNTLDSLNRVIKEITLAALKNCVQPDHVEAIAYEFSLVFGFLCTLECDIKSTTQFQCEICYGTLTLFEFSCLRYAWLFQILLEWDCYTA